MKNVDHTILYRAVLFGVCLACVLLPESMTWAERGNTDAATGDIVSEQHCLSVSGEDGGVVLQKGLAEHERFILRHRHSVHRSLVVEYLGPGPDGTISILEGRYADYGAGLPQKAEKGQTLEFEGGTARIIPVPVPRQRIEVRVGREAEHTVIHRDREYPLAGLLSPGMTAVFTINEGVCPREHP